MRRQRLLGNSPMEMLGQTIKLLFSALFICTVMVVIAGIFGAGAQALMIYQIMLGSSGVFAWPCWGSSLF